MISVKRYYECDLTYTTCFQISKTKKKNIKPLLEETPKKKYHVFITKQIFSYVYRLPV